MLRQLGIKNIAIIESLDIEFFEGFNCLTGETGAGKSILIDSIGAVLGAKTSRELIRSGEKKATVSAVFSDVGQNVYDILDELGIDYDEGEDLIVTRTMYLDSRNVCRINSTPVTVAILKKVGALLINIHGQSDSDELMRDENAIKFLDEYCRDAELLDEYERTYKNAKRIQSELEKLKSDESERLKKIDMLTFQIDEIDKSKIYVGEKAELERKRSICNNLIKLKTLLADAARMLAGDTDEPGSVDMLFDAAKNLTDAGEIDRSVYPLAEELNESAYAVSDISARLDAIIDEQDEMSLDINEIEQRLDLIYNLSRKYGETEQEILLFAENARGELENCLGSDERREKLHGEFVAEKNKCKSLADDLSKIRHDGAAVLEKKIEGELKDLCMENAVFKVDVADKKIGADGRDDVKFLISTNRAEGVKPLTKTAAGGELSRIMLAIKNVFAGDDFKKTLIFDEIDRGVSGKAAEAIGKKISSIGAFQQVLCITHLANVVSFCDREYLIKKTTDGDRTLTSVCELDEDGQIGELARLIGGDENDEVSREAGKHLLERAREWKIKKE